jgi:hypothetical protein
MDRLFCHTLSFDALEVLVLVENGGASPREVEAFLGMDPGESTAVFRDLVRCGLLDWEGRPHAPGALPLPWRLVATVFQLTPMARSLRQDAAFTSTAFAAALLPPPQTSQG